MLAIRMQRTGRKGSASFRVIVQDSRFSPNSGRVVARVGHFDPHTKEKSLDVDKISHYLSEGAQPSPRVVRLLLAEKVKMPSWVLKPDNSKKSKTKNPTKLRKNQPKETKEADSSESKVEESNVESSATETEAEAPKEEASAEEKKEEATEAKAEEVKKEEPNAEEAKGEQKEQDSTESEEPKSAEKEAK